MGWNDHTDPFAIASNTGNHVCAVCVNDYALATIAQKNADERTCSFCDTTTNEPSCAPIQKLIDHISECIFRHYDETVNVLNMSELKSGKGYESSELMDEIGFDPKQEELRDEVVDALGDRQWCDSKYYSLTDVEAMQFGWKAFQKTIKHQRRFTFHSLTQSDPDDDDVPPVGHMLRRITSDLAIVNVIQTLPVTMHMWRVRFHDASVTLNDEADFCPAPTEHANQSNRMSPAGVVMFYGAEGFETAARETVIAEKAASSRITGVQFFPQRPLKILDLTALPFSPSFFDLETEHRRATLGFLHGFVRDVSASISRDGREHVEYTPTQAFTEYVRYEMVVNEKSIDGISYKSAKDGKKSIVIFCDHDLCRSNPPSFKGKPWLIADMSSIRSEPATSYVTPPPAGTISTGP